MAHSYQVRDRGWPIAQEADFKSNSLETKSGFCCSCAVPRYYFHLVERECIPDPEGKILPGIEEARQEALEHARSIVCENIKHGWLNLDHRIDVADDQGRMVLTLTFRQAFEITG